MIRYSIKKRYIFNLLTFAMLFLGVISLKNLKREVFPNVNLNIVTVTTALSSASPHEIEKLVTIPIEDELYKLDDIEEMISHSTEGLSIIIIKVDPDLSNIDRFVNEIQRAVDRVEDLPDDLDQEPFVEELRTDIPAISLAVTGDLGETDLQYHTKILEDQLRQIPSVNRIERSGWRDREIWVETHPDKLQEYHFSIQDIMIALHERNKNMPAGTVLKDRQEYLVRTIGELRTVDEIRHVILRANDQGHNVFVKDIADVTDTFEDEDVIYRAEGQRAIILTIHKNASADVVTLVQDIRRICDAYQERNPTIHIKGFDDFSALVKRRLSVLLDNGKSAILLVSVCLILFLVPTVAVATVLGIPFAILGAMIVMHLCGISINLVSMFALILVLGIIVDDAIVVAENTFRYIERGVPPEEAAYYGAQDVLKPVLTTVLTTIIFFIPLLFMKGVFGKYIFQIPLVIIICLSLSLLEAFFILPAHITDMTLIFEKSRKIVSPLGPLYQWIQKLLRYIFYIPRCFLRGIMMVYQRWIHWAIIWRYITLAAIVLSVGVICKMITLQTVLFPKSDVEQFYINLESPLGASQARIEQEIARIEKVIADMPQQQWHTYITTIGLMKQDEFITKHGDHLAQIKVYLDKKNSSDRDIDTMLSDLRQNIGPSDFFTSIRFEQVAQGPPVGRPIAITLKGDNIAALRHLSEEYQDVLANIEGVGDIIDDYEAGKREYQIHVRDTEAQKTLVSVKDIAMAVQYMLDGGIATTIKTTRDEIDIRVRYPEEARQSIHDFQHLFIPNAQGNLIPFSRVASIRVQEGISTIQHIDRKRVVHIYADIDTDVTSSAQVNAKLQEHFRSVATDYPDILVSYRGEYEDTRESMESFREAFLVAVPFLYITLAVSFQSLLQPFIVMFTIPIGIVGGILALALHQEPVSFIAILGIMGLSGVVVNDAIILVDTMNINRRKDLPLLEAVYQATKQRIRPIWLTTITTVAGLAPVAYGWGSGMADPFLKPMALTMGWGLAFATLMALFLIPSLYCLLLSADGIKMILSYAGFFGILLLQMYDPALVKIHHILDPTAEGFLWAFIFKYPWFAYLCISLFFAIISGLLFKLTDHASHFWTFLIYPGIYLLLYACLSSLFSFDALLGTALRMGVSIIFALYPLVHAQVVGLSSEGILTKGATL